MPTVSIITPAHNSAQFISETIQSVLSQSFSDWEMIIIDDFSTDNSVEVMQAFVDQDSRIKLIQLSENSGAAVARNTAIEAA
ncbi:MAG: glycosyltransferase family 2 protein, partial [Actinobacteria bacterium]|nr:glycosyltransferase family 2 protein [Actinomycetota bacterium]